MNYLLRFSFIVMFLSLVILWLSVRIGVSFRNRCRSLDESERDDFGIIMAAILTLLGLIIGLIDTGCSLPIEHVHKFPRVLSKIDLQLPLFVDHELCGGKQNTGAFVPVLIVYIDFASTQVKCLRWRVGPSLNKTNLPVSDEADFSPGRSRNQSDITHVITESTRN